MYCTIAILNAICFLAQNGPNPDWEKKVTEYFREKLKENNATNWVKLVKLFRVFSILLTPAFLPLYYSDLLAFLTSLSFRNAFVELAHADLKGTLLRF